MQYLQVLRKFRYFCNVAIMPIKQICNRIPEFVQNGIVTHKSLNVGYYYENVNSSSWPHVFLVSNEYNALWTAESWCSSI